MAETMRRKSYPLLVVDDDQNGNQVICDHLRFRGYRATPIHSGEDALGYLEKLDADELPQAILLDVLMPGMNGCEVLQAVRSRPKTRSIPVILVSVLSKEEIADQFTCPCSGFDAYLNKPFEMDQLIKQLEKTIHG